MQALAEYDASVVVPTHYVLFTLASILAPSILYQELTLDQHLLEYNPGLMVTLFILGISCTCGGVMVISGGKVRRSVEEDARAAKLEGVEMRRQQSLAKEAERANSYGESLRGRGETLAKETEGANSYGKSLRAADEGHSAGAKGGLAARDGAAAVYGFDDKYQKSGGGGGCYGSSVDGNGKGPSPSVCGRVASKNGGRVERQSSALAILMDGASAARARVASLSEAGAAAQTAEVVAVVDEESGMEQKPEWHGAAT